MHSFTTERLLIRPFIPDDEELYCQLFTDEKIMRNSGGVIKLEQTKKNFANSLKAIEKKKKAVLNWAIIEKESLEPIGFQALSWLKPSHSPKPNKEDINQVEIGIMLLTKANGKQYPEEAMGALMEYAFNYQNIDRINAFYANKNLATKRFLKKLQFTFEDELQPTTTKNSYQYFDKPQWQQRLITKVFD
ncbi:GNAT family N-acetyltransferase [Litorilituus lipolyticus]|uniref:N-acetyltransferase n=1 Tax=Litorilituus lipolyticus TaxID=2491017 RepID=A0A502KUD5_9GAMM|nr:GNAT family N-acetyltransferase [Litorilituus lipolyticus]TPH15162.1 N-acetyltransferase [Litorilituus lipolyticus]